MREVGRDTVLGVDLEPHLGDATALLGDGERPQPGVWTSLRDAGPAGYTRRARSTMTTTDDLLRRGSDEEIREAVRARLGIEAETDSLAVHARAAALLVRRHEAAGRALSEWLGEVIPRLRGIPELPDDPDAAQVVAAPHHTASVATTNCLEVLERLRGDLIGTMVTNRRRGNHDVAWDDLAFAVTAEWLWRHAGRAPLKPVTMALLARGTGVDSRAAGRTLHWKHVLSEARRLLDADVIALTPTVLVIRNLSKQHGEPEHVIAHLRSPGWLDELKRRRGTS